MPDLPLDIRDELTGIRLVPAPVQLLGGQAELDDEVAGQVLRLQLARPAPSRPVIVVLDAHDVVLAEIAAGLYLDQLKVDLARIFEAMPGTARNVDRLVLVQEA